MTELLTLYAWTVLAGAVVAIGLSMIGAQLASRGQSAQALVVAQASALGVVAGLAVTHMFWGEPEHHDALPLFASLGMAALFYLICERGIPANLPSRNSYYIGLFTLLLSLTYSVTALVPSLETHMATSYFGDLALITDDQAKGMILVGAIALIGLSVFWRTISGLSFDKAVFGTEIASGRRRAVEATFIVGSLSLISLAIQYMGLLFTVSALLLPALLVGQRVRGLKTFTWSIVVIAASGAVIGFAASLWHGRMPTVPAIVVSFVVFGAIVPLFSPAKRNSAL